MRIVRLGYFLILFPNSERLPHGLMASLFQTFGSYLIYDIDHKKDNVRITTNSNRNAPIKRNPCEFSNKELNLPKIFVQHLRGRQYDRNSKNNMNKSVFGHV